MANIRKHAIGPPLPPAKLRAGRPCTICHHPEREAIDKALVAKDTTLKRIAVSYVVGHKALQRHLANHVPTDAVRAGIAAVIAADIAHGGTLAESATALRNKALELLAQAQDAGDLKTALMGVREAARCVDLMGRLAGDLSSGVTLNLQAAPALVEMQSLILAALADEPSARLKVVAALTGQRSAALLAHDAIDVPFQPV